MNHFGKLTIMSDLVSRLATGEHRVTVGGPDPSLESFQQAIDRRFVHIKFTDTKGQTDIGVKIDIDASESNGADFENGAGLVHIEGDLTLDYIPVRLVASIDLSTLNGTGRLIKLAEGSS